MMKKILVVEDELLLRDVLHDHLSRQDYEVFLAGDATKGFELATENKPDLALIDIKLPRESGIDLTVNLKELCPEMIIIIMTGFPSLDTAVDAMKKGASEYIIKPFRLVELNKIIKKYTGDE